MIESTSRLMLLLFSSVFFIFCHSNTLEGQASYEILIGAWQNELGSVLHIDSIGSTGEIYGHYASSTGVDGKIFPLDGKVNATTENPHEFNLAFMVRWEGYGSITSWTGYFIDDDKGSRIKTLWHLVRSGKEYDWERIITNSSTFSKM